MKKLLLALALVVTQGCGMTLDEVTQRKKLCIEIGGVPFLIANVHGELYGVGCTIDGVAYRVNRKGALSEGRLEK